jgi:hypothetical protein
MPTPSPESSMAPALPSYQPPPPKGSTTIRALHGEDDGILKPPSPVVVAPHVQTPSAPGTRSRPRFVHLTENGNHQQRERGTGRGAWSLANLLGQELFDLGELADVPGLTEARASLPGQGERTDPVTMGRNESCGEVELCIHFAVLYAFKRCIYDQGALEQRNSVLGPPHGEVQFGEVV